MTEDLRIFSELEKRIENLEKENSILKQKFRPWELIGPKRDSYARLEKQVMDTYGHIAQD